MNDLGTPPEAQAEIDGLSGRLDAANTEIERLSVETARLTRGWDQCRELLRQQTEDIAPLRERVERLTRELETRTNSLTSIGESYAPLVQERDRLRAAMPINYLSVIAEREQLRAALEWYANPPLDDVIELHTKSDIEDLTRRAREALRPAAAEPCRIFEYDGAFKCFAHKRKWGAITDPDEPCAGWLAPSE